MNPKGLCSIAAVLGLFLWGIPAGTAADQFFTSVDELPCAAAVTIKAYTTCSVEPGAFRECTEQRFVFADKRTARTKEIKLGNGDADAKDAPKERYLYALAFDWACLQGKDEKYVIVRSSTGGTCNDCEWCEIYSLSGEKIASDRTYYEQGTEERDRVTAEFEEKYRSLGLPRPWPHDAFVAIKRWKIDASQKEK